MEKFKVKSEFIENEVRSMHLQFHKKYNIEIITEKDFTPKDDSMSVSQGTIENTEQIRKNGKMKKSIKLSESYKELDEIQKIIRENEDEIKEIYDQNKIFLL